VLSALLLAATTVTALDLQQLAACREKDDDAERVACYDAVVDALAEVTPDTNTDVPQTVVVAPNTEETFGRSAEAIRREQLEKSGVDEIEELSATITEVRPSGRSLVEVTLDNGQRWRQASGSGLSLDVGDEIVIRPAALGSYRLSLAGSKRSMKVRRIE